MPHRYTGIVYGIHIVVFQSSRDNSCLYSFVYVCYGFVPYVGIFSVFENQSIRALLKGFFEMTVGCGAVAECREMAEGMKCVLCTAIMSWGGLSVLGQSMSMLSGSGVSFSYLFVSKMTHCIFSTAVSFIIASVVL